MKEINYTPDPRKVAKEVRKVDDNYNKKKEELNNEVDKVKEQVKQAAITKAKERQQ